MARLCAALGVTASQIVRFFSTKEMEYDADADLWIRFAQGRYALGLKKKGTRCIFLDESNLCSVYSHRPFTCRTFPYVVEFDDNEKVCSVTLNNILDCNCSSKEKSSLREVIRNVAVEMAEDDIYYDKILEWNSRKSTGTRKEFLKFVSLE